MLRPAAKTRNIRSQPNGGCKVFKRRIPKALCELCNPEKTPRKACSGWVVTLPSGTNLMLCVSCYETTTPEGLEALEVVRR